MPMPLSVTVRIIPNSLLFVSTIMSGASGEYFIALSSRLLTRFIRCSPSPKITGSGALRLSFIFPFL